MPLLALTLAACRADTEVSVASVEYGDKWPFTVDSGWLRCERESLRSQRLFVTLDTGHGIYYALNGSQRTSATRTARPF